MVRVPKGFRSKVKLVNDKVGLPRRQEILDDIDYKGTYLPRGVDYEDIDSEFVRFVKEDIDLSLDGDKVPVIFLSIQRWSEFTKVWEYSDKYGNIDLPFISVVRQPNVQVGTNQNNNWNLPKGVDMFRYIKVPTFEGGRKGVDVYKIPQPTSVNVEYEVRLFCNRMVELNKLNNKILRLFNARQYYVNVNGHPMPLHLEGITDESVIDDITKKRYYIQTFNIELLGYILNEDDFEVVPTVSRLLINEEISTRLIKPKIRIDKTEKVDYICFSFIVNKYIQNRFNFKSEFDVKITKIELKDIESIEFKVNGVTKEIPFFLKVNDNVEVNIVKGYNKEGSFDLTGELI